MENWSAVSCHALSLGPGCVKNYSNKKAKPQSARGGGGDLWQLGWGTTQAKGPWVAKLGDVQSVSRAATQGFQEGRQRWCCETQHGFVVPYRQI